jgi:hypothetical protein
MDDFFSWDFPDNCIQFHNQLHPQQQIQLLLLWDFISCPYEDKKQEHGTNIKIIGFWVNSLVGSISLPPDSIQDIILKILQFINTSDCQPPLCDWWKLVGHLNWMLNILPWGRLALTELYCKTARKAHSCAKIYLNATIINNLFWLATTISNSIGVRFVNAQQWDDNAADFVLWTDASGKHGLAFVFAGNDFAYQLVHSIQVLPLLTSSSLSFSLFFLVFTMLQTSLNLLVNFFCSLTVLTL